MKKLIAAVVVALGISVGAVAQAGAVTGSGQPFPCSGTYASTVTVNSGQTYQGNATNEIIFVQGNNNVVYGNSGDDCIVLNGQYNTAFGGDGNDIIFSDSTLNTLNGERGDDKLYANAGSGTLNGAQGNDTCYLSVGSATTKQCENVISALTSAKATATKELTPYVSCVEKADFGDGVYSWFAHFGYTSTYNNTVKVAVGVNNNIAPYNIYVSKNQPTSFAPGNHDKAFFVAMGDSITWTLNGKTAVATQASPACY